MTHRIVTVNTVDDFVVNVIFQNGIEKQYDLKPLCDEYPIFQELQNNVGLFAAVKVDVGGYGISWNDDIDLSADELWEKGIETNKVHKVELCESIGYIFSKARSDMNITQKELAEITHIYQADISKIERGLANPSIKTLERLAEGMGMELHVELIQKK